MRTLTGEELSIEEVRRREEAFARIERAAEDCETPAWAAICELTELLKPLVLPMKETA